MDGTEEFKLAPEKMEVTLLLARRTNRELSILVGDSEIMS